MRGGRLFAALVAAVPMLASNAVIQAQQPPPQDERTPARPAPVQTPPTGPMAPIPAPPQKETEPETPAAPERVLEPPRIPEDPVMRRAPSFVGPDLFNPPAHQGWISIVPSLTLSAEYNDNLGFTSRNRQSDVILAFTPGLTLSMQRRGYRLLAGYNVSGQLFLDETDLSDFGKEQQFFADYSYEISPTVSFTLGDRFVYTRGTNALTSSGSSVGFEEGLRNTLSAGLRWQATPNTGFGVTASHQLVRFPNGGSEDSDTYRAGVGMDYRFTPRLSGNFGVGVAYIDFEGESSAWTYTPTAGLTYDITPTLRAYVGGGPVVTVRRGETELSPAVATGLTKTFKFGSASIGYDRAVTAETVGISDRQSVFGSVDFVTLLRGLQLSFLPRYSISDTDVSGSSNTNETVKTFSMTLQATYLLARGFSLIGSYTYYHETQEFRGTRDQNIDQNRVFFGVQYAYPINIY